MFWDMFDINNSPGLWHIDIFYVVIEIYVINTCLPFRLIDIDAKTLDMTI